MDFLSALLTAILLVGGIFLALLFVGSIVVIASALDKIANAFVKWCERR